MHGTRSKSLSTSYAAVANTIVRLCTRLAAQDLINWQNERVREAVKRSCSILIDILQNVVMKTKLKKHDGLYKRSLSDICAPWNFKKRNKYSAMKS